MQRRIGEDDLRLLLHVVDDAQLLFTQIERIGRTQGPEPQASALVMHLHHEGQHVAHRQTDADNLQNGADQTGLLPAAGHAEKGKGHEDGAENGGRHPPALEAEGVKQSEAAEDGRVDFDMNGDGALAHGRTSCIAGLVVNRAK